MKQKKQLGHVLNGAGYSFTASNHVLESLVSSVEFDSREVKEGSIFVALSGEFRDGHAFAKNAVERGAVLIVGTNPSLDEDVAIPYLQVDDSKRALARLASELYSHPSREMRVIGVTGTSGKTTTTYILESIFAAAGSRVGVVGTVNYRFAGRIVEPTHTTPLANRLQELMAEMRDDRIDTVVMEVSSHALQQYRVGETAFDGMVFTNLSPEHLDYHKDMEDYFASKKILFTDIANDSRKMGKTPVGVVNGEDSFGKRLTPPWKSFGCGSGFDYSGDQLTMDANGISGSVGDVEVKSSLVGEFNLSNLLAATSLALELDVAPDAISRGLKELGTVPGRLERIENARGVHVFVDYAHKPGALEKVLQALQGLRGARILTVVGCGGDRDRQKRPLMAKIAVDHSDHVLITSDNPRTEAPEKIIEEMVAGIPAGASYEVLEDRGEAIRSAISQAKEGDIVLIAGKGHEDYQIIADPQAMSGTRKIHFDDREVAREALGA